MKIESQKISLPILKEKDISLFIKRLDAVHPFVSGNKSFKLKYNIIEAKRAGYKSLLTFGGAYSNHIAATAYAARYNGLNSIGVIRGEEYIALNPTLRFAIENRMFLHYVNRNDYRLKNTNDFLDKLRVMFGDFYLLHEGGSNDLAVKGTEEILGVSDTQDYICCSVGTGATISGIINSSKEKQQIIGFSAIKGCDSLVEDVRRWTNDKKFKILDNYHFGGYANISNDLVDFINDFYVTQDVVLDVVYTGKMMMGILDLVAKDYFEEGSTILAIHTGGLQGNKGMIERLGVKLPS